jgi:hypothetical protein
MAGTGKKKAAEPANSTTGEAGNPGGITAAEGVEQTPESSGIFITEVRVRHFLERKLYSPVRC